MLNKRAAIGFAPIVLAPMVAKADDAPVYLMDAKKHPPKVTKEAAKKKPAKKKSA